MKIINVILLSLVCSISFGESQNSTVKASLNIPASISLWPSQEPPSEQQKTILELVAIGTPDERHHVSNVHQPELLIFLPEVKNCGTAVVICPGGSYHHLSIEKEGIDIAKWFNSFGIAAFVLEYRMKEYGHPAPLNDAQRAISLIRSKAKEFNINPNRLGIMGFSAGGHLAATAGTHFRTDALQTDDPVDAYSNRPDFYDFTLSGHLHASRDNASRLPQQSNWTKPR